MSPKYDCIIIGGGPAAVHAAFPLVEAGLLVLMLDGGIESDSFDLHKDMDFDSIRRKSFEQHLIFLGKDISGALPLSGSDQAGHGGSAWRNDETRPGRR